jgi:hypothetical protein
VSLNQDQLDRCQIALGENHAVGSGNTVGQSQLFAAKGLSAVLRGSLIRFYLGPELDQTNDGAGDLFGLIMRPLQRHTGLLEFQTIPHIVGLRGPVGLVNVSENPLVGYFES